MTLLSGSAWPSSTISYDFPSASPGYDPAGATGWSALTVAEQQLAVTAMQRWSDVANITWVAGPGQVTFQNWATPPSGLVGYSYYPSSAASGGDVWVDPGHATQSVFDHELGHALGLQHDDSARTIMVDTALPQTWEAAPRIDDIIAVQSLYGANATAFSGDTVWGWNSNTGRSWATITDFAQHMVGGIWDTGGHDTLDFSGYTFDLNASLVPGSTTTSAFNLVTLDIAPGVVIEDLIGGSGNDMITGNDAANDIRGMNGNDRISGGDGNDTLNGNAGNDFVDGGNGDDYVYGGQGDDQVFGGAGNDLVNGNIGQDVIHGGAGADLVYGGQGNDVLYGDDANDTLSGDLGDDSLYGGAGADRFTFAAGSGHDLIEDFSSAAGDRVQLLSGQTWTLADVNGQAVVTLSDGGTIGFAGLTSSQLGDWIV